MPLTPMDVRTALASVTDPDQGRDIVALGHVQDVGIRGRKVTLALHLAMPEGAKRDHLVNAARQAVAEMDGVDDVEVQVVSRVAQRKGVDEGVLKGVKNVIAVASGKGGVGKSTVSANLALALKSTGAEVGLLDADMYGPSMPTMFAVNQPLTATPDNKIIPIEAQGVHLMSIGFMAGEGLPVIWRGPMVSNMVQQMLNQVAWPELDYLVIDLPPGTGDTQLTLCQMAPLNGAVIVTTPQDISLIDAHRGLEMFRKLNVPVIGLIENMSGFTCGHCGNITHIFSEGGGKRITEELDIPFLGAVPLDPEVVASGDAGQPIISRNEAAPASVAFAAIARTMAARLHAMNVEQSGEAGDLTLKW